MSCATASVLEGRSFVAPEDVKAVAISALAHRLTLTPQTWASGIQPAEVVQSLLSVVAVPATATRHAG